MKQHHISILSVALVVLGVSGCTGGSNPVMGGASSTGGGSSAKGGSGPQVSEKDIFSNLSELHYTPTGEGTYRISPNDVIEVSVFRVPELSGKTRRVDQSGRISLPLVGNMVVAKLTEEQLEQKLKQKLSQSFLQNPEVSVYIKEQSSREVTVGGRVKRAGVFPLKSATTVSQAVAMAGGLTELADPSRVVLFRPSNNGQFKAYHIDLKAVRAGKMRDPYISGKDQVIVHESGSRVWLQRVTGVARGFLNPLSF